MPAEICETPKFKRKQKVVAVNDLPGVPEGTKGKVFYEAGITWFRYHVLFENGVELANVDGNDLVTVDEWAERQQQKRRAEIEAARDARTGQIVVGSGPRKH
jgi:hypothetical protein